jgi:hypothetical protein
VVNGESSEKYKFGSIVGGLWSRWTAPTPEKITVEEEKNTSEEKQESGKQEIVSTSEDKGTGYTLVDYLPSFMMGTKKTTPSEKQQFDDVKDDKKNNGSFL